MPENTITYLEMHAPQKLRPAYYYDDRFQIVEQTAPNWQLNREMYFAVGADWKWTDKQSWSDEQWRDYAESPGLRTFVANYENNTAGYYELRRGNDEGQNDGSVEIAYIGLLPAYIGKGLGGALLTSAIENAWANDDESLPKPKRVWVHTCTFDHHAALANYEARGLTIYKVDAVNR